MTDQELREVIREARLRELEDPHRIVTTNPHNARPGYVRCACGRTFEATTQGRAAGSWRRHHATEESRRPGGMVTGAGMVEVYDVEGTFYGPFRSITEAAGRSLREHGIVATLLPVVVSREVSR